MVLSAEQHKHVDQVYVITVASYTWAAYLRRGIACASSAALSAVLSCLDDSAAMSAIVSAGLMPSRDELSCSMLLLCRLNSSASDWLASCESWLAAALRGAQADLSCSVLLLCRRGDSDKLCVHPSALEPLALLVRQLMPVSGIVLERSMPRSAAMVVAESALRLLWLTKA